MDGKLEAEKEINDFSPANTREHTAWMAWYLRGIEKAENLAAEILYPTIDTDE